MARNLTSLFSGLLFGVGLAFSGMTHPEKVLGFLDITGAWDPSLLFVLIGAVGVTLVAFRFVLKRPIPILDDRFYIERGKRVDARLLTGAAIFGAGWGISGYCPGPAIALAAAPTSEFWVFVPALLLGAALHAIWRTRPSPPLEVVPDRRPANTCG